MTARHSRKDANTEVPQESQKESEGTSIWKIISEFGTGFFIISSHVVLRCIDVYRRLLAMLKNRQRDMALRQRILDSMEIHFQEEKLDLLTLPELSEKPAEYSYLAYVLNGTTQPSSKYYDDGFAHMISLLQPQWGIRPTSQECGETIFDELDFTELE